jgi:hypothetical protein
VEVKPPPYPEYREETTIPTRDYRVVFWEQQLPPKGLKIRRREMGWAELTIDLADVQDVHEAIEWAENNIDVELDKDGSRPHGDRVYVLYAKVPQLYGGRYWWVQIAGWDPTRAGDNLDRRHPLSPP